jgi:uncharacterized protein
MTMSGGYVVNLGPSVEGFLTPAPDQEAAPFWDYADRGELRIQVCGACRRLRHPPRPMCPHCRSTARQWTRLSGRGRIWSFIVPHPPLLSAYAAVAPYNVIVVELEEDPSIRFVGNLVTGPDGAINEIDPATITIGESVQVTFARLVRDDGSSVLLPRWVRP